MHKVSKTSLTDHSKLTGPCWYFSMRHHTQSITTWPGHNRTQLWYMYILTCGQNAHTMGDKITRWERWNTCLSLSHVALWQEEMRHVIFYLARRKTGEHRLPPSQMLFLLSMFCRVFLWCRVIYPRQKRRQEMCLSLFCVIQGNG